MEPWTRDARRGKVSAPVPFLRWHARGQNPPGAPLDAGDAAWFQPTEEPESGLPDRWSVFGTEGRWLGTLPELDYPVRFNMFVSCHWRFSPCWIDRDFFLAVRRDGVGVERVEGYRIRRNG